LLHRRLGEKEELNVVFVDASLDPIGSQIKLKGLPCWSVPYSGLYWN